jgi:hypothetical protein
MTTTSATTSNADAHLAYPQREGRQLTRLLEIREQLARYSTERFSHELGDADEAFAAMIFVEDCIAEISPVLHAVAHPRWLTRNLGIGHEPGGYNPRCGICKSRDRKPAPPRDTELPHDALTPHQAA